MMPNNFNENDDDSRFICTDMRRIGNCCLMICALRNGLRFNLFLDDKGAYRIWSFLATDFRAEMWPDVLRLVAAVSSGTSIKLEITSELDLCCFSEGTIDPKKTGSASLEAAINQFICALTKNESLITCLANNNSDAN